MNDLYPDEIPIYYKKFMQRQKERQEEKYNEYLFLIQSIHSANPNELYSNISRTLSRISSLLPELSTNNSKVTKYYEVNECDKEKLEALKRMKGGIIKKRGR